MIVGFDIINQSRLIVTKNGTEMKKLPIQKIKQKIENNIESETTKLN